MDANPSPTSSPAGWDFFPLVTCISLREREERYEQARRELGRAGLSQVTFYRASRQADRDKAIIDSHMACLQYAVERAVPWVLVFEDDVLFQEGIERNLRRVTRFLGTHREWKIFYLGGFIFRKRERPDPHILRGGVLTTHAYAIKTEFAKEALARRPFCAGMSIDLFYSALVGDHAYVHVDPLMCIQRPSPSDGTWDKGGKNKEGWLGKAMIYTSLDFRGRLAFNQLSWLERVKLLNGIAFFKFYRCAMRKRLARAEIAARRQGLRPPPTPPAFGEFVTTKTVF